MCVLDVCLVVGLLLVLFVLCCVCVCLFFLMIRRPPRSTLDRSSAASDVYKRQLGDEQLSWLEGELQHNQNRTWIFQGSQFFGDFKAESGTYAPVSYTHLRAHETVLDLVCRLLLENKKITPS